MGVHYVLSAVLPRYTMRRANLPLPPARASRREAEAAKQIAAELLARAADAGRGDLDVMGHD